MVAASKQQLLATGISKNYRRLQVLDHVELAVHSGEVVALTGENGAGKSTLMRICAGLIAADAGVVQVADRIGYCPQVPSLLELLTADEHLIMFGTGIGLSREDSLRSGHALLAEFDFPVGRRLVTRDMSGGTRQKLNLALALLGQPSLLLLDEPYQGFDRGTYINFWDHCDTWRAAGSGIVVVTHMLAELGRADRIVEMSAPDAAGASAQ